MVVEAVNHHVVDTAIQEATGEVGAMKGAIPVAMGIILTINI